MTSGPSTFSEQCKVKIGQINMWPIASMGHIEIRPYPMGHIPR